MTFGTSSAIDCNSVINNGNIKSWFLTLRFWRRKPENLEIGISESEANVVMAENVEFNGMDVKSCWNDVGKAEPNTNDCGDWFDVENVRSDDDVVVVVVEGNDNLIDEMIDWRLINLDEVNCCWYCGW